MGMTSLRDLRERMWIGDELRILLNVIQLSMENRLLISGDVQSEDWIFRATCGCEFGKETLVF